MRSTQSSRSPGLICLLTAALLVGGLTSARAQEAQPGAGDPAGGTTQAKPEAKPTFEIYGFAMLDIGHDFKQINPDWFDTMRVTQAALVRGSVRARQQHVRRACGRAASACRSSTPTALGDLKTTFEFELFGTGVDAGQTTFRLRHAYGELGAFGAGQDLEPVHGSGCLPELARVLGTDGHGLLPQRPGALDAGQG